MRTWTRDDVARLLPKLREVSRGSRKGYEAFQDELAKRVGPQIVEKALAAARGLGDKWPDEHEDAQTERLRELLKCRPRPDDQFYLSYEASQGWRLMVKGASQVMGYVIPWTQEYVEKLCETAPQDLVEALELVEFNEGLLAGLLHKVSAAEEARKQARELGLPELFGFSPYLKHAYEDAEP